MSSTVGVVVPAYRPDVETLRRYLVAIRETVAPATLRVELDAPEGSEVAAAVRETGATVNVSATRRGKGEAVSHGFDALDTDVLAFADADGSTAADSLADVIGAVTDGGADVAVGSRRHPASDVVDHQSLVRRRFGDGFAALARVALGVPIHDFQCGAKALTAAAWADVREHVHETGFAWDFEVVAVADALDHGIHEVPVQWQDHPESTVPPVRTALSFLRTLAVVRRRTAGLSRADRTTDGSPVAEDDATGD